MSVKSIAAQAAPTSFKDTLLRAAKTFVAALVSGLLVANWSDVAGVQALVLAAGAAGANILLNAALAWANS
jgi:hypothetical protein